MKTSSALALVFLLFCSVSTSTAQQFVPTRFDRPPTPDEALEALDRIQESVDSARARASAYDEEERRAYNAWVVAYTQEAYAWHHRSTVMIFYMVAIVVLSGVVLAAWQLHAWIARMKAYDRIFLERLASGKTIDGEIVSGVGQAAGGQVTLKSNELALSSPYVGVVILGLSMGFFMAYLLFVYPIMTGP